MEIPVSIPSAPPTKVLLCIDDDESILRYQRIALERRGYTVVSVSSAREGLRLALKAGFDGIIIDNDMPELSGHQVASAIHRANPETPIIMFSASNVPAGVHDVVNAFVVKPPVRRFLEVVTSLVSLALEPSECSAVS